MDVESKERKEQREQKEEKERREEKEYREYKEQKEQKRLEELESRRGEKQDLTDDKGKTRIEHPDVKIPIPVDHPILLGDDPPSLAKHRRDNSQKLTRNVSLMMENPSVTAVESKQIIKALALPATNTDILTAVIIEAENQAAKALCQANLYRLISVLCSLFHIVGGTTIAVLSASDSDLRFYVTGLGAIITAIHVFYWVFKIGEKGSFFKHANIKLKDVAWAAREAALSMKDEREKIRYAVHLHKEIDQLDLSMFKMSYNTEEIGGRDSERSSFSNERRQKNSEIIT